MAQVKLCHLPNVVEAQLLQLMTLLSECPTSLFDGIAAVLFLQLHIV